MIAGTSMRCLLRKGIVSTRTFAFAGLILFAAGSLWAGLDPSKKKEPRIIKPETSRYKTVARLQDKRYRVEIIDAKKTQSAPVIKAEESKADSRMFLSVDEEQIDLKSQTLQPSKERIQSVVANASEDFREAYEEALRIELEKRAIEIERRRQSEAAEVSQDDINRYSQVQRGERKAIEVKAAAQGESSAQEAAD